MQVTQAEIDQAYEDLDQAELALVRAELRIRALKGEALAELLEKIEVKWSGASNENIVISAQHIHTDCLATISTMRAITPCSSSFGDFQVPNEWDKEFEPWELEDMRRLRQGLQDFPFGGSMYGVQPPTERKTIMPQLGNAR